MIMTMKITIFMDVILDLTSVFIIMCSHQSLTLNLEHVESLAYLLILSNLIKGALNSVEDDFILSQDDDLFRYFS
jgi:hypothetical protein